VQAICNENEFGEKGNAKAGRSLSMPGLLQTIKGSN
jgi:hypothetical protein